MLLLFVCELISSGHSATGSARDHAPAALSFATPRCSSLTESAAVTVGMPKNASFAPPYKMNSVFLVEALDVLRKPSI